MNKYLMPFKKNFLILFVFFLPILALLLGFLSKKTPPQNNQQKEISPTLVPIEAPVGTQKEGKIIKIEKDPSAETNELGEVFFNYQTKKIPASGTIYTQAPTSIPAETISKIQEKLIGGGTQRIINTPSGQVIFMQKDAKTLTIYLYSRTISYSYSDEEPSQSTPTDTQTLTKRASDFIRSLDLSFDDSSPTIKYFSNKAGDLIQVYDLSSADLIDISFKEQVSGLTVFRQFGSDALAHVWFSKMGNIKKFTYFYAPQYLPQKSVILPSLSEVEKEILENKGTIVSFGNEYQQPRLKKPTKTTFTSVELGYFNSGTDPILHPIFVFRGNSTIEGSQYPITVYIPVAN